MKPEIQKLITHVKAAQTRLQIFLKNQNVVEEARKYAEKQGKEVKKLLTSDLGKVKVFIERERKELARFQKQIPGEVKKLRSFVENQRGELEKLLTKVRKVRAISGKKPKARKKAASSKKKSS